jgi:hypothetical protein
MMTPGNMEAQIQELHEKVKRLQDLNQILLDHLRKVQNYSSPGKGPGNVENLNRWLIDLSNAVTAKFMSRQKI